MSKSKRGLRGIIDTILGGKPCPRETHPDFEIIYDSVISRGDRLCTISTRPRITPHATVMLIQGLGCFSIEHNGMYQWLLYGLTRQGYATLRVDKPGTGASEGGPCAECDFERVVDGYRQALHAAIRSSATDGLPVFVFGHSLGGIIAPLLASEVSVAGLIVHGTRYRPWADYYAENLCHQDTLRGLGTERIEKRHAQAALFARELYLEGRAPDEIVARHPSLLRFVAEQVRGGKYIMGRHYRFFQQLGRHDIAETWQRVATPVLALSGASDFTAARVDHELIVDAVNARHPGRGTLHVLAQADHWFQEAASPEESLRRRNDAPFAPEILDVVCDWLTSHAER